MRCPDLGKRTSSGERGGKVIRCSATPLAPTGPRGRPCPTRVAARNRPDRSRRHWWHPPLFRRCATAARRGCSCTRSHEQVQHGGALTAAHPMRSTPPLSPGVLALPARRSRSPPAGWRASRSPAPGVRMKVMPDPVPAASKRQAQLGRTPPIDPRSETMRLTWLMPPVRGCCSFMPLGCDLNCSSSQGVESWLLRCSTSATSPRATGLAPSALRFYERRGLLELGGQERSAPHLPAPDIVERLGLIVVARDAGFSVREFRVRCSMRTTN